MLGHGLKGVGITAFAAIVLITSSLSVSPIAADSQEDGPHCYSTPPSNYDPAWCLYERQVMNYPRCVEIWTGYNEMLEGYDMDMSALVRDVAKDCQLPPPPAHPPPLLKSETPITGCESYTGTEYDDCINSQLDDILKGVKDPCGDPSSPNYVKCLLGNKPYTPKIQRAQQDPGPYNRGYPYDDEICDEYPWTCPPFSNSAPGPADKLYDLLYDEEGERKLNPVSHWLCSKYGPDSTFCHPVIPSSGGKEKSYRENLCGGFKSLFPGFCF